ncbi:MAG: type VI secretion system Vgr family protein [Acetobacteraceae bacterium]
MTAVTAGFARTEAEQFTEDGHPLAIETPLGNDHLLLTSLQGDEGLSRLFAYKIEMVSADHAITPESLIGRNVKILVSAGRQHYRPIHGVIRRFHTGPTTTRNFRVYRAEVVPWLWFLTQTTDCRIFQNLNIPDILSEVFGTFGFTDYEIAASKSNYPKLEFCVQYRETAFNFVSRLMEQAGITYFFRHDEDRHVLVISDRNTTFQDLPNAKLVYAPNNEQSGEVTAWEHSYEFRSGRWAQTDFDFEAPSKKLVTNQRTLLKLSGADTFERFAYPGGYVEHDHGSALTRTLMETEEAAHHAVRGASRYPPISVGGRFELDGHPSGPQGRYVIKSVSHDAADPSYFGNADARPYYANSFEAIPYDVPFRPPRTTEKPVVHGPQTAIVVGPPGEKIFTDRYGRVRVQFHWDRYGQRDDKSSCWIRVSQAWAGQGWGNVNLPHVGHEVVVSFLEGDPDHPLITGRVYNGENATTMAMPDHKTQSGIKDHSGNEILMEGKGGSEDVRVHAVKDMNIKVDNDRNHTVVSNETMQIGGHQTQTIDGHRTETVNSGETVTVNGGRTHTVNGVQNTTVSLAEMHSVGAGRMHNVGAAEAITVGAAQMISVGAAQMVNVGGLQSFNVGGPHKLSAAAIMETSKGPIKVKAGSMCVIEAPTITLQAGGSKIIMDSSGITLKGTKILSKADANIMLDAGSGVKVKGGAIGEN